MANLEDNQDKKQAGNFVKYTGIAFQMLATIGVFAFIGYKIDEYRANQKHFFMAILGLLGVVLSLYQVIRAVNKNAE